MIFIFKNLINVGLIEESELISVEMNFLPCPVFHFRGEDMVPHPETPEYVRGSLLGIISELKKNGHAKIDEVKVVKVVAELKEENQDYFKTIIDELSNQGFKVHISLF